MKIDKDIIRENLKYYDKSVIVQIIDIFMEEFPGRIEELQKNITDLDFPGISHNAHSLKGVVAYFSPVIAEIARKLEELGRKESSEDLQQIFDELKTGLISLVAVIREMRPEYEN